MRTSQNWHIRYKIRQTTDSVQFNTSTALTTKSHSRGVNEVNRFTRAAVRRNRARDEYFMSVRKSGWCVYIVECADNTYYTGITNDLGRRVNEHNVSSKGAKYTASRRPVTLLCYVQVESRSEASKLEASIKKKRRKDKLNFMKSLNCIWV